MFKLLSSVALFALLAVAFANDAEKSDQSADELFFTTYGYYPTAANRLAYGYSNVAAYPSAYPVAYQGAFPTAYQATYPAGYQVAYPARYQAFPAAYQAAYPAGYHAIPAAYPVVAAPAKA